MIIAITVTLFFLILRFTVTLFNFLSNPKLPRIGTQHQQFVSILIPARNEENNILKLLQSIAEQDYHNYEAIIYDDGSADKTYELCTDFAAKHKKFKVVKGEDLPEGWIGKNHACHQLAKYANGEYLLYLDADETIKPGLINSAVHRMQLRNLGLLSLFTNQTTITFGEKAVVPLMHFLLLNLLPLRLIYLTRHSSVAAASGQFMLFNAEVYHKEHWHKSVSDKVVEDVEIMKKIKKAGYNGESLLANGLIHCRMYTGYFEAINGFSKNFLAIFNYSVLGFLTYITMVIGGPLMIITTLNLPLIFFMSGLIILTRIMISLSSGQHPVMNVLLHPLQMFSLTLIAFLAIQKYLTRTTVWKDRKVQ